MNGTIVDTGNALSVPHDPSTLSVDREWLV